MRCRRLHRARRHSCAGGIETNTCAPGAPTGIDATCDTLDDDCDGTTDEAFVSTPSACGIGACASIGSTTCIGGAVLDTCAPGSPVGTDATCDGRDDDCDAFIDEAFTPTCVGTSTLRCVAGSTVTHDCSDSNACTGIESCNAATCVPGVPPTVDDGNACTADACDPHTGVSHTPTPGVSCSDGNPCNGAETCDASAHCASGTPLPLDDGNVCTADVCDPLRGVTHDPLAVGASCDDGDPCNGIETCDGAARCLPGPHPLSGPCAPAAPVARIFIDEQRDVLHQPSGASVVSFTGTSAPSFNSGGFNWSPTPVPSGAVIVLDLVGSDPVVLDQFRARGQGTSGARHIEWSVSTTSPTSGFSTPVAFEAPNTTGTWVMPFAPVNARWLRIRILDNWNGQIGQGGIQIFTAWTRPRDGGAVNVLQAGASATASSVSPGFVA